MSTFGDWEPADAADTDPPHPEALARLFVRYRKELSGDPALPADYEHAHPFERALLLFIFTRLVQRLLEEWPHG